MKYRGWDLKNKKPVWISCFTFHPNGSIRDVEIVDVVDGKAVSEWRKECENLTLIRSTGLFDESGKEIWEYDIVKQDLFNEFGSCVNMTGIMVWDDLEARWLLKFSCDLPLDFTGRAGKPVILGNKFMHPDLLKKNGDKPAPVL
jgi:hypothetical protein